MRRSSAFLFFSSLVMSSAASLAPVLAAPVHFCRGDANADGWVDISDPVNTMSFLFNVNRAEISCQDAADADDTGSLDITDALYLLG
jgi:hypothetical protein